MRNYEYKEKKVQIGGGTHKAIIPKVHSRIKGLVFEWRDLNYGDGYSNRTNYARTMYVLYKGDTTWTFYPMNDENMKWATDGIGFFAVLHNLESERVKKRMWKENRIRELKEKIPKLHNELEKLTGTLWELEGKKTTREMANVNE